MTTTVTTVTESVTPVTVIVIQSQLLSSSHSYRHNAAISAAWATCGQHKGPNMMMFSPLYQQRSAAASKLRVQNLQPEPVWTSLDQFEPVRTSQDRFGTACARPKPPVWNNPDQSEPVRTGLEQLKPVRNLQSGTIRLKPVQTNPAESKTSSQNQPEPVRTSLDRLDRFGTA